MTDAARDIWFLSAKRTPFGAFGIEGEAIVIVDALELENLDFNEFQAVLDDMSMAMSKHHTNLSRFYDTRPAH